MCEQLGFGRLARIVKDTQFDPQTSGDLEWKTLQRFIPPKLPRQWMVRSVQSATRVSGWQSKTAKVVPTIFPSTVGA